MLLHWSIRGLHVLALCMLVGSTAVLQWLGLSSRHGGMLARASSHVTL